MSQRMRTLLDFGPLIIYLVAFYVTDKDIPMSTGIFMVATFIALGVNYVMEKKLAPLPLFTGVVVGIFGGLTIYLNDESFIMMKPTIINGIMAVVFYASAVTGKNVLGAAMGPYLRMTPEGWKGFLTRFAIFFVAMAVLNEILRHNLSFENWLIAKFGLIVLTFAFSISQGPYLMKHMIEDEEPEAAEG